jgi:hypothetical protein
MRDIRIKLLLRFSSLLLCYFSIEIMRHLKRKLSLFRAQKFIETFKGFLSWWRNEEALSSWAEKLIDHVKKVFVKFIEEEAARKKDSEMRQKSRHYIYVSARERGSERETERQRQRDRETERQRQRDREGARKEEEKREKAIPVGS